MEFKIGDKVTYCPEHGNKEIGIIKSIHPNQPAAFVVYHCAGNWEVYFCYTGELTNLSDLKLGWYEND